MTAARNRAEFPRLAAVVDQVRRYFPDARLVHGVEQWRELGTDVGRGIAWEPEPAQRTTQRTGGEPGIKRRR